MPRFLILLALFGGLLLPAAAHSAPLPQAKQKPPAKETPANEAARKAQQANDELEHAVTSAGNDRQALVHNLRQYLDHFPDSPRREQVYRALVEALLQLGDTDGALDYTERLIALRPEDPSMMLLAVDLLERQGDENSSARAVGYTTRVIDRVEKAVPEDRPAALTPEEWQQEQQKLLMSLYLVRGRLELHHQRYDEAAVDLQKSYHLLPNPGAAARLGELAEMRGQYESAIQFYLTAFTLPEDYGVSVDRRQLRQELGNAWRLVHGSEAGLGERLLAAYDEHWPPPPDETANVAKQNAEAKELGAFVVRSVAGDDLHLDTLKGQVTVLNFWATWCLPCDQVARRLGRIAGMYSANPRVSFLSVNCDDDESLARVYAREKKLPGQVVFADGLQRFFQVNVLPTVIVLDTAGHVVYRGEGFSAANLEKEVTSALGAALAPPPQP